LKKLAPSSKAKRTPPTGAPKAAQNDEEHVRAIIIEQVHSFDIMINSPAATPAAAPAETKSRLCLSVRKYLNI
jgi:hypothetical protein